CQKDPNSLTHSIYPYWNQPLRTSGSTQTRYNQKSSHLRKMTPTTIKNGKFKKYWILTISMDCSTITSNGKATLQKKLHGNPQKTLKDPFDFSGTTIEQILMHPARGY